MRAFNKRSGMPAAAPRETSSSATGKPCVVRDLPANREWADGLDLADSPGAFVAAVKKRLEEGMPESQRLARRRLEQESWEEKAREFERMIDE